ncbi:DUF3617 domain-containing protein [Sphingomonas sp. CJ20]
MRTTMLLSATALLLAGCQSAAEKQAAETGEIHVTDVDTDQVSRLIKAARAKTAVQPGQWRQQIRILSADIDADTPEAQKAQQDAIQRQSQDTTACRTEKDLKPLDLEKLEKVAGTCRFARYDLAKGRINADLTCKKEGSLATRILAAGTSTPTGFDILLEQQSGTKGAPGFVAFKVQAKGTRLGACPA